MFIHIFLGPAEATKIKPKKSKQSNISKYFRESITPFMIAYAAMQVCDLILYLPDKLTSAMTSRLGWHSLPCHSGVNVTVS